MRLVDKTVIITGASSGIGSTTARLCAKEGAALVLGARRKALLDDLAHEIDNGRIVILQGDAKDERFAIELVELGKKQFGAVDAGFYNCGILGDLGPIPEMSEKNWRDVLDTNLTGAFFAAKHLLPAMRERKRGSIVFTSSFVGNTIGLPGMGAYAASKAGIVGLTKVLAAEHGAEGIRVNAILPGGTRTEMAGNDPAFHEFVENLHALKRMAEPDEIAQAALFLLSDQASFVTGSAFFVDGGNSICKT